MTTIPLAQWAAREGISRRYAEYLANEDGFPASKEKRVFTRRMEITVVPVDFKFAGSAFDKGRTPGNRRKATAKKRPGNTASARRHRS